MRTTICFVILVSCLGAARAQPFLPVIKKGTSFNYTFYLHGQQTPFELIVQRFPDTLVLGWSIRSLAGGTYIIDPAGFSHGHKMNFVQPSPGMAVKLGSDETFCMISRAAFSALVRDRRLSYDNTVYDLKDDVSDNPVLVDGRPLDVLHVMAEDETTELWILNNPDFPLVCKIRGSVLGIDCLLRGIR